MIHWQRNALKIRLAKSGRPNTLRGYETASLPHLYAIRAGKGERLFDCRSVISRFAVVRESDAVFAIEDIDFIIVGHGSKSAGRGLRSSQTI